MDTSALLFLFAGLAIGGLLAYIIASRKAQTDPEKTALEKERDALHASLSSARREVELHEKRIEELKGELQQSSQHLSEANVSAARAQTAREAVEKQIEAQRRDIAQMQEAFRKDFENLANKIFNEKTAAFNVQSRTSIDQVLEPLKVRLKDFQEKVEQTHKDSLVQATSLREEIKSLRDTGQRMSVEAENLTRALKNDSKVQGNWGEMILENILEASGLVKDREYFLQRNFSSEEGRRLQPDVMIQLPEDKWVIVDSKVSLTAYERYIAAEDEDARNLALKAHILSLRNHIKGLSSKSYQDAARGKNLDFILLFIPIEPAYLTALNADPTLFNDAYDRGIVMVCPSTLIASLKIIASTWKHEYQNKNALEIAQRGKLLLEKFVNFVEDMDKIGIHLERSSGAYADAMKKLKDGRGNLMDQAKKLEDLGIKTSKQIGD